MRGISSIGKIPELQKRITFTILMLGVYRIGVHVPTPGIDISALKIIFEAQRGTLFGMMSTFTGGALERMSVFALGIMPYISASIIIQLLTSVVPHLERLSKEGEAGKHKITQYTRYGTVGLSVIQGFAIAALMESYRDPAVVLNPGWPFMLLTILTLCAGTSFIMWLGEQISERGIGNGISLIIFAGIVADMPNGIYRMLEQRDTFNLIGLIIIIGVMVGAIWFVVLMERAQRRIPVQYAKRIVGRKMYQGIKTHLPLKLNTAGVIPPIFASSLLIFPATIASAAQIPIMDTLAGYMNPQHTVYNVVYVALIVFFCYFYTAVVFNPVDVADNLKKNGGYVPGVRPGKSTAEYIDKVLSRITLGGAVYVSLICVLPSLFVAGLEVPFYFGGTGLLIIVGVSMDTIAQIEAHLLTRDYDGFLGAGAPRMRGRRGR